VYNLLLRDGPGPGRAVEIPEREPWPRIPPGTARTGKDTRGRLLDVETNLTDLINKWLAPEDPAGPWPRSYNNYP
jgi:hypothetical protein